MERIFAVTSGEPAGVGPELCARLAGGGLAEFLAGHGVSGAEAQAVRPVILGDRVLLAQRSQQIGLDIAWCDYQPGSPRPEGALEVLHIPLAHTSEAGKLNLANGRYVLDILDRAIAGCQSGEFAAMVTAPIHKGVICEWGEQAGDAAVAHFSGHTEYLAEKTDTPLVVMMLAGGGMRVALTTTHLPLRDVADAITPALLTEILTIVDRDLRQRFGLENPRILVAGLNPHAGEGGHMGREEIDVIIPVLETLRAQGMNLEGPLPADTLFVPHHLQRADAVLAMYHDQGLPVLKHASFGGGVNVTLGLPIVRTSVDHGTALDLAGTGKADHGSLFTAMWVAWQMCAGQKN